MSDEHIGPCGKYCAVVDECDARGHEITRLRAENEKLREALEPIVGVLIHYTEDDYSDYEYAPALIGDLRAARAAIEGVTEKSGAGNE